MDFNAIIKDVLTQLGTAAAIVAALAYLGKIVVKNFFASDLAKLKAKLEHESRLALVEVKNDFAQGLAEERSRAEAIRDRRRRGLADKAAMDARMREEVTLWANPVLDAVRSLENRLENILDDHGYECLDAMVPHGDPNWSATYEYFFISTLYYFGQYFCWTHLLALELSYELLQQHGAEKQFFDALAKVSKALGDYHSASPQPGTGVDKQVFRLQQRAMGEVLVMERPRTGGAWSCVGYAAFERRYSAGKYGTTFTPLGNLLNAVKRGETRFNRLRSVKEALADLRLECERILNAPPPPPKVP